MKTNLSMFTAAQDNYICTSKKGTGLPSTPLACECWLLWSILSLCSLAMSLAAHFRFSRPFLACPYLLKPGQCFYALKSPGLSLHSLFSLWWQEWPLRLFPFAVWFGLCCPLCPMAACCKSDFLPRRASLSLESSRKLISMASWPILSQQVEVCM